MLHDTADHNIRLNGNRAIAETRCNWYFSVYNVSCKAVANGFAIPQLATNKYVARLASPALALTNISQNQNEEDKESTTRKQAYPDHSPAEQTEIIQQPGKN